MQIQARSAARGPGRIRWERALLMFLGLAVALLLVAPVLIGDLA